uniref:Uncharacterized protein n=1 Tax=Sander lucioperca TaxID=283035 RepID=A0A8D0DEJ7_SANLU
QKPGYGQHKKEAVPSVHSRLQQCEVLQPRKLNGSSVETPSYQNLHRNWPAVGGEPELQRVLEQRRLELHKDEEMARQQPSDLETELRKSSRSCKRRLENQQKIPEFVRVKDNLRRTQMSEQ